MTVYSTDLSQVIATIRETLVHRVAGHLTDTTARLELGGVIEALDNLVERIDWDAEGLTRSVAATEDLARELGVGQDAVEVGVAGLRQRRRAVSAALASSYQDEALSSRTVAAVLGFTDDDVRKQISVALRAGLPG